MWELAHGGLTGGDQDLQPRGALGSGWPAPTSCLINAVCFIAKTQGLARGGRQLAGSRYGAGSTQAPGIPSPGSCGHGSGLPRQLESTPPPSSSSIQTQALARNVLRSDSRWWGTVSLAGVSSALPSRAGRAVLADMKIKREGRTVLPGGCCLPPGVSSLRYAERICALQDGKGRKGWSLRANTGHGRNLILASPGAF